MKIADVLLRAQKEIIDLRKRNEVLRAQVETMEVFAAALGLRKKDGDGAMAPDITYELQQAINESILENKDVNSSGQNVGYQTAASASSSKALVR